MTRPGRGGESAAEVWTSRLDASLLFPSTMLGASVPISAVLRS